MPKKPCIYALTDPDTNIERYIGKADDPYERYLRHLQSCHLRSKTHKNDWIKSLLKQSKRPGLVILMCCDEWNWELCERFFIAMHRIRQTHDILTNDTDGGDGQSKGYKPSDAARRKQSEAQKGKPHPWNKGKGHSKETRKKISKSLMGNTHAGRGEMHPKAKMTEAKVIECRQLYATGELGYRKLAKKYDITRQAIRSIIRCKTWREI